jgi:hypothetical protein
MAKKPRTKASVRRKLKGWSMNQERAQKAAERRRAKGMKLPLRATGGQHGC